MYSRFGHVQCPDGAHAIGHNDESGSSNACLLAISTSQLIQQTSMLSE